MKLPALKGAHGLRSQLCDDGWMPAAPHVCVTGLVQWAVYGLHLAHVTQNSGWRDAAWRALARIKRNQRTVSDDPAPREALPGAAPSWSGPAAFCFDTLSAKYFADALMMDMVGIAIPPVAHKVEPA